MIIFNLWAIPVALLVYLVILGLKHFFPGTVSDQFFPYTLGSVAIVVGGITELIGLKARVFLLPVWLIGIAIICIKFGPIGWVVLGVITIACLVLAYRWVNKKSAEEWKKTQEELIKSPNPPIIKEQEFWIWVKTTLYFPLGSPSPEQSEHDLKVLQGIKSARPQLASEEAAGFNALEIFLTKNKDAAKSQSIDRKLEEAISKIIKNRISKAKPETSFQTGTIAAVK